MEDFNVYKDIQDRTGGEIYIGVVGPVRTGKSTFIKKFMDTVVIPNIPDGLQRDRAIDELPQSAAGRTIMTTEPKFIPEQAVSVQIDNDAMFNVRMIDNMAAEIGTKKVFTEHSTIGLVISTDVSFCDIPREEYEEAEERVIDELNQTNRPFVMLLNCVEPSGTESKMLAAQLSEKYSVPVLPVNCIDITEQDIKEIIASLLYQFPVREVELSVPGWVASLGADHWLYASVLGAVQDSCKISRMREVKAMIESVRVCEAVQAVNIRKIDLGSGRASAEVIFDQSLFYKILSEKTELEIGNESELLSHLIEMTQIKRTFQKLRQAYDDVLETGYGIVMPDVEELTLEEPQILKQNGKYGIRLKATAPSIHMLRTQINTEITPIVGSEQQSEELVLYLLKEFEENPVKIWESNIFGKSLHSLVNEGMHNKLYRMPNDAREKVRETIERIINDGCSGLICIIL